MRHVSSRSGVATLRTAIHLLLTYLLLLLLLLMLLLLLLLRTLLSVGATVPPVAYPPALEIVTK